MPSSWKLAIRKRGWIRPDKRRKGLETPIGAFRGSKPMSG